MPYHKFNLMIIQSLSLVGAYARSGYVPGPFLTAGLQIWALVLREHPGCFLMKYYQIQAFRWDVGYAGPRFIVWDYWADQFTKL